MARFSQNAHWRDTARPARFFFFDSRAAIPLLIFLLHIRLWTLILAVSTMIFFGMLERFGFTVPVFLRWLRSTIAGKRRLAIPWWRKG